MFDVRNDADHSHPTCGRRVATVRDSFADGVLAWPEVFREKLVDDRVRNARVRGSVKAFEAKSFAHGHDSP